MRFKLLRAFHAGELANLCGHFHRTKWCAADPDIRGQYSIKDKTLIVRQTIAGDIAALQNVADATELFPGDMLPDMVAPFLDNGVDDALWLTCCDADAPNGFCYARPEEMTDGTWNMLAIAVDPGQQSKGAGALLVAEVEATLRGMCVRVLIVDTSGTEEFSATRRFYIANGYEEEARIRDFWAVGDDKIIFRKAL